MTGRLIVNPEPKEWFCSEPLEQVQVRDWIDLSQPHYFVVIEFDLDNFVAKMKTRNPDWSFEKCRRGQWKKNVMKELKAEIKKEMKNTDCDLFTTVPEEIGVNVVATAKRIGIPIETKPKDRIFKIALIGRSKKNDAQVRVNDNKPTQTKTGLRRFERRG